MKPTRTKIRVNQKFRCTEIVVNQKYRRIQNNNEAKRNLDIVDARGQNMISRGKHNFGLKMKNKIKHEIKTKNYT